MIFNIYCRQGVEKKLNENYSIRLFKYFKGSIPEFFLKLFKMLALKLFTLEYFCQKNQWKHRRTFSLNQFIHHHLTYFMIFFSPNLNIFFIFGLYH